MKLSTLLLAPSLTAVLLGACASTGSSAGSATAGGAVVAPADATPTGPNGKVESDIVFNSDAKFAPRDCNVTISYTGPGTNVQLAGEFTPQQWADGAIPMVKTGNAFTAKVTPTQSSGPGQIWAYKLIVDGNWILDPNNTYRKIVGDQMNSGLVFPNCTAAPQLQSGKMALDGKGSAKVHVQTFAPTDGTPVDRIKASFDNNAVDASNVSVNADGSVDFSYAGLAKGKHTITMRVLDKQGRQGDEVDLPFWVEGEAFDYQDGLLYMIMLDRFADGDTTNNKQIGAPVDYDADWHGGDLEGALQVLQTGYFEKLGVRTIWLSPTNEQTETYQLGDGNQNYSAYHGYWPTKARSVEPRFGGADAMHAFITEAHKRGIRVLLDLINNQVFQDHEYVSQHPDWFRTLCQCGTEPGCGWSERPVDCYFEPYMPDINWTVIGAERQFISDAVNWISEFDLDGFRVDAVKHVEANAVYDMRAALSQRFEQGGARIFMAGEIAVGEYDSGTFFGVTYNNGYDWLNAYTSQNALDGAFDFVTKNNISDGLANGQQGYDQIEAQVANASSRYVAGNRNIWFLNGHDNPRTASVAAQDPKLGCLWSSGCRGDQLPPLGYTDPNVYANLKRASTVLFSMPGVPYMYMGDEVAFGGGADPDMRRNMLFDGADTSLAGLEMAAAGATPSNLNAQQLDYRNWIQQLGQTRLNSRALRRGVRKTLLATPDLWVYAWQSGPGEIAIIALNRGAAVTGQNIDISQLDLTGVNGWKAAVGNGTASGSNSFTLTLGAGEATTFIAQ